MGCSLKESIEKIIQFLKLCVFTQDVRGLCLIYRVYVDIPIKKLSQPGMQIRSLLWVILVALSSVKRTVVSNMGTPDGLAWSIIMLEKFVRYSVNVQMLSLYNVINPALKARLINIPRSLSTALPSSHHLQIRLSLFPS